MIREGIMYSGNLPEKKGDTFRTVNIVVTFGLRSLFGLLYYF
jgi:hypothetical protein